MLSWYKKRVRNTTDQRERGRSNSSPRDASASREESNPKADQTTKTSWWTAAPVTGSGIITKKNKEINQAEDSQNNEALSATKSGHSSHGTNDKQKTKEKSTVATPPASSAHPTYPDTRSSTPAERADPGDDELLEWQEKEIPLTNETPAEEPKKEASAPTHPRISPWLQVPPTILAITIAGLIGYSQLPMKLQHPVKLDTIAHKACYTLILILAVLLLAANLGYIIHKHCTQPPAPGK